MSPRLEPDVKSKTKDAHVEWHSLGLDQVVHQLDTHLQNGLSSTHVERRRDIYGFNQLTESPRASLLSLILNQLKSFVVILLIAACIISMLLGEWVDAIAVLVIVVLNAVLGVVQESRAEDALAALQKLAAPEALVLRDGHRTSVPARELVPGDLVFLETGNYVPADVRLVEAINLKIDESALTGESNSVQKNATVTLDKNIPLGDRRNTVFSGSVVTYGRGKGIVVSTGMNTQLGMVATMLQSVEKESTPLQKRLDQLGKLLGWGALGVSTAVFLVGWLEGGNLLTMFMTAVSLAIAAVPEGLPAVVTITLALGMREMVRRHALIRRLSSVETLGSATIICSDKTGTLTQNEMTVTRLWMGGKSVRITGSGYRPVGDFYLGNRKIDPEKYPAVKAALWVGALNNDALLEEVSTGEEPTYRIVGDPTEAALMVAAVKAGAATGDFSKAFPRLHEIPFDSERKRMVTLHTIEQPQLIPLAPVNCDEHAGLSVVTVKGAPDVILSLCSQQQHLDSQRTSPLDDRARKEILAANDALTADALRVLGVGYRLLEGKPTSSDLNNLEKDFIFVGLIGIIDPAREEVKNAINKAKNAGIRTIMITGDYPNTARAVAESIGLLQPGHKVITGTQLNDWSDAELIKQVKEVDIFARVSPVHKMRIVKALKSNHEIVAMTGDGVNDAPAIKQADIGVAMGITGTDVAKQTADMVLTDDNYASIVSAVEQGRIIYNNIRKFVYFLVSCNLSEILVIFLPIVLGRWLFPYASSGEILAPLTAIQILMMNLITDGGPAVALSTEKGDPDIMNQPPRPTREPIINKPLWINIVIQTIAFTIVTLLAFGIGLKSPLPKIAETMAFITLSLAQVFRAISTRSDHFSILKIGLFSSKWMNLAVAFSIAMILIVVYVPFLNKPFNTAPLQWEHWTWVLPLAFIPAIIGELSKLVFKQAKTKSV
jgi:Ca2+-transporting ATPase